MKTFFQYVLIVLFLSLAGAILINNAQLRDYLQKASVLPGPCQKPLEYSLGNIDSRFGISEGNFLETVKEAEKVWEDPTGRNLFQYNPEANFKINLVYDSRQEQTVESRKLEDKLTQLETSYDSTAKQYGSLSAAYNKRLSDYKKAVDAYSQDLKKYNSEVEHWNSQGGAPEDVYADLVKEKRALDKRMDTLEKEKDAVNALAEKTNNLANLSNQAANVYNNNLNTYKNRFGDSVQFDKGIYNGQEIDIYQFYETGDLRLTVAHELGHAIGLDHDENSKSVMYYLMGDQDMDHPEASVEDIEALNSACKLD
jgi:myosin heavy subunit